MVGTAEVVEGRVDRKTSNALRISFRDGPAEPLATAVQSAGDGTKRKLAVLFGFKSGGTGNHALTFRDGSQIRVESNAGQSSVFRRPDGTVLATIARGTTSVAFADDGTEILSITPRHLDSPSPDLVRLQAVSPSGEPIATLDVVLTEGGWSIARAVDELAGFAYWWDKAGKPLGVPIPGTRLTFTGPPRSIDRDVLLCICVDIAIGLRRYVPTEG